MQTKQIISQAHSYRPTIIPSYFIWYQWKDLIKWYPISLQIRTIILLGLTQQASIQKPTLPKEKSRNPMTHYEQNLMLGI